MMISSKSHPAAATLKPIPTIKKKRNQPGIPDPEAEVIALSPRSLMATNRFVCEICHKGFQRDQNLQLHRRGHNLPWKLCQRRNNDTLRKKVYICPENACVHHAPSRALGDLTGIKKHYSRKHGEKKWKCEKCSKKYAVQSDWKAHSKSCGTREYKCDCGTLFSRKDSFITHRAFCDALVDDGADETKDSVINHIPSEIPTGLIGTGEESSRTSKYFSETGQSKISPPPWLLDRNDIDWPLDACFSINNDDTIGGHFGNSFNSGVLRSSLPSTSPMSATALLQKAALMGSSRNGAASSFFGHSNSNICSSSPVTNTFKFNDDDASTSLDELLFFAG